MNTLSDVASEAIWQLLADLEAVERMPGLRVDMHTWGSGCAVCLGGAHVMRATGCTPNDVVGRMRDYPELQHAAGAGDALREADLRSFYELITDKRSTLVPPSMKPWTYYEDNPQAFKDQLATLAEQFEMLEEAGVL